MATSRERLRLMVGDPDKLRVDETFGVGNGSTTYFKLKLFPVRAGTEVFVTETAAIPPVVVSLADPADYALDDDTGKVVLTSAPSNGLKVVAQKYEYNAFSDTEMDDVLGQYGSNLNLCAAHVCRALAVQASRWFAYWSGNEKVDKSECAENFRKMAKDFEDLAIVASSGDADIGILRTEIYDPTAADDEDYYGILQG